MAKTPEGGIKDFTKGFLIAKGLVPAGKADKATAENTGWFHMPVALAMGVMGIPDFYGHYYGFFFEIETKVPGKDPTALQQIQLNATTVTGAKAFVVRCEKDLQQIAEWFDRVEAAWVDIPEW